MKINKVILEAKNSQNEYLFDIVLSGENTFSHGTRKTISRRRIQKGFVVSDNATIEPGIITITGSIADIATITANLQSIDKQGGIIKDEIYRGILAQPLEEASEVVAVNPKKFSDDYRKILNETMNTRDVMFDIRNPKDNTLIYKNYYLSSMKINEIMGAMWGFTYELNFEEVSLYDAKQGRAVKVPEKVSTKTTAPPTEGETQSGSVREAIPPPAGTVQM